MQKTVKDQNWQDQQALDRYTMIAPLLDESLDPARRSQMRQEISERRQVSQRTLYRYEAAYKAGGFSGLKPAAGQRRFSQKLPDNYPAILQQAIQLKKEVPKRSIKQIIFILEQEGWAAPGVLKRSTVYDTIKLPKKSVRIP